MPWFGLGEEVGGYTLSQGGVHLGECCLLGALPRPAAKAPTSMLGVALLVGALCVVTAVVSAALVHRTRGGSVPSALAVSGTVWCHGSSSSTSDGRSRRALCAYRLLVFVTKTLDIKVVNAR